MNNKTKGPGAGSGGANTNTNSDSNSNRLVIFTNRLIKTQFTDILT